MSTTYPGGTAAGTPTSGTSTGSYPIDVQVDYPANPGKLYAIPVIGWLIRIVLLIPHLIAVYALMIALGIVQLFAWVPVLFGGTYPAGLYRFTSGTLRWYHLIQAYTFGLTDTYPPFSLDQHAGYPIRVTFERPEHSSPGWAIPVLGYVAKAIILIPHFVVLYVLTLAAGLIMLVSWIPVLSKGEYPAWAYSFNTGLIRWSTRAGSYFLGLTDQYPPFRLAS